MLRRPVAEPYCVIIERQHVPPCLMCGLSLPRLPHTGARPFSGGVTSMIRTQRLLARAGLLPRRVKACTSN